MSYQLRPEMLVETYSFDPTRLDEGKPCIEKLGGGRYRFRAKAQHCGVKNRNNRVYPVPVWEQHTTSACAFIKRVRSRRVIGHLEHPTDGKSAMGMAAVLVVEVEAPNDKGEVWAIFETLSTPAGMIVASFIRDGVGFGISSRGNGSVVNKGGIDEVQEDYEPITFDMVIDESTPGAEVHARRLKESLCALMESAGGDAVRAIRMDQQLAEAALERDLLSEGVPPTGFSRFCLAYENGSAHYRAYDNGVGQWDVWLHPHNLPPEEIVTGLSTVEAAGEAAKQHYRMVVVSGRRDAKGEAAQALKRDWPSVRETFSVRTSMPYSGIAVKLAFSNNAEAKSALAMIQRAGFHADLSDEFVTVYTSIEDEAAAIAHLTRLLSSKGIEIQAEAVGFIRRGQAVWEDAMTLRRLDEMPYGGMEEMPYGGMGTDYDDEPMYEEGDPEGDEDDEEDDEEGDETDEMVGVDDPEDLDLDLDVDEAEEDMYEEYEDETEMDEDEEAGGHVRVWFGEDDEPAEYHYFSEDGILEAVTDAAGDILFEMPTSGQRAAFAKAFARDDAKATKKSGTASAARRSSPKYYQKFRRKWAKKNKSDQGAAKAGYGRFLKGKRRGGKLAARIAKGGRMSGRKATHIKGKAPVAKSKKRRRSKKESVLNQETNLIETYVDDTLVEMSDPETGLVLFELAGGKGSPAAAMFAKMFSKKGAGPKVRAKSKKNYSKLRAGYSKTKAGSGMSAAKLKKGSRALPKGEKGARKKARTKAAPVRKAMRTLRKGAKGKSPKAARIAAKGTTKRGRARGLKATGSKKKAALAALRASHEFELANLLIEDETDLLYSPEMELVGGITEDGDIFFYDEEGDAICIDPSWLGEDESEYEEYEDDDEMDEMEVGAHGGGKPVALRMKGTGQEGRGVAKPKASAHGGGAGGKTGVRQGSGKGTETEDESYDPYVERLESQIARQQEVIDAYQDLQHAEALESAKAGILGSHPELSVVESRLDRCQSAEEMRVEAEALLTLVESSRGTRPWTGEVGGNGNNNSSSGGVNSGSVDGAPPAELLAEEQVSTGFDAAFEGAAVSDTASRVAAARRRRLDEAQN